MYHIKATARCNFKNSSCFGYMAACSNISTKSANTPNQIEDMEAITIKLDRLLRLNGHMHSVYNCKWNPNYDFLASGARDLTARIWDFNNEYNMCNRHLRLFHGPEQLLYMHKKKKGVSSVDWNSEGTLLVTGSYDSYIGIWNIDGELVSRNDSDIMRQEDPVSVVKWNREGNLILSAGLDATTVIWDGHSGEMKQKFNFHTEPVVDVSWRTNTSFASCSSDKCIHVCELGPNEPVKTFIGHKEQVNAIKWDPSGQYLASGSDDSTLKIWTMDKDECLLDFKEHQKAVYTIKWSPSGGSAYPNVNLLLASGSIDGTVRLWDVERNESLHILSGQGAPVYSVDFSPDGKYIASGSLDKYVRIWSTRTGEFINSYKLSGRIVDVSWNFCGKKIATCTSDGSLYVSIWK
ncbi:F-box-like/WD repeat-containing protein TBL1X [Dinothrombium tinctorium]|uniref:F-box-like/WD repeat-containing protein TBL1X n=1 Tax=Dinothrombium tinctorium TaxID=1965070 RepID=A0A3S3NU44_9ACAR|nr:F-box-like/WD repeat-containing protein TBL1X [Dinothrombium tinctorium]RWS01914.1 F-box-like/WD repeat-containing protein TBL1X [Dinothrombium tinctorium]RWS05207.1 F-box-like/WD repeat-containing protein TBL1X [Dinothrombium tinctorium]